MSDKVKQSGIEAMNLLRDLSLLLVASCRIVPIHSDLVRGKSAHVVKVSLVIFERLDEEDILQPKITPQRPLQGGQISCQ